MQASVKKALTNGVSLLVCFGLAGAAGAQPPGGGKGGGKPGGGKTSLWIELDCIVGACGLRSDGGGTYYDGVDGVQAFISSDGDELVFNTGNFGDPRDVHWDFSPSVSLLNGTEVITTQQFEGDQHRTVIDVGRNAGGSIRDMRENDAFAVDMWADLSISESSKKKDATSLFMRFESYRAPTFGMQRCLEEGVEGPGISGGTVMQGTDVTIRCTGESAGACNAWEIEGTEPLTTDPAIACTYAVFPDSVYRGDRSFGRFVIRATAQ